MAIAKTNWGWIALTALLVIIIIAAGTIIWLRYPRGQAVEIALSSQEGLKGQVSVSGAISNPGIYPLKAEDSIDTVIRATGGLTSSADLTRLKLHIPYVGEESQPQKVDINRAELWLLELLPGIGHSKAQAIIDYRSRNGPFRNIYELTKVAGIGEATLEKIKNLITVSD